MSAFKTETPNLKFNHLAENQQSAVKKLACKIHSLLSKDRNETLITDRVMFLSGKRGTGKTSVLKALQNTIESNQKETYNSDELQNLVNEKQNLIWLELLDLDPLPSTSNLLVSILLRIQTAIGRCSQQSRGMLDPCTEKEEIANEIRRLVTDFTIAWEGNLQSRQGNIDPDTFALEVRRAESARLKMYDLFSNLLNKVRDHIKTMNQYETDDGNANRILFVLPVDDFDLNPKLSLELLKLIRMISVPGFCTLLSGDLEIAEEMFDQKVAGDL